jgi:hypothetical protein
MNVELKRRVAPFGQIPSPVANDNAARQQRPAGPRAIIYRPSRCAMTSGRAGTRRWLLEFAPQSAAFVEPLMGWTGSTDPLAHVRLSFPSKEAAISYAERGRLTYEVREQHGRLRRPDLASAASSGAPHSLSPASQPGQHRSRQVG